CSSSFRTARTAWGWRSTDRRTSVLGRVSCSRGSRSNGEQAPFPPRSLSTAEGDKSLRRSTWATSVEASALHSGAYRLSAPHAVHVTNMERVVMNETLKLGFSCLLVLASVACSGDSEPTKTPTVATKVLATFDPAAGELPEGVATQGGYAYAGFAPTGEIA